jgi:hypothetical protein
MCALLTKKTVFRSCIVERRMPCLLWLAILLLWVKETPPTSNTQSGLVTEAHYTAKPAPCWITATLCGSRLLNKHLLMINLFIMYDIRDGKKYKEPNRPISFKLHQHSYCLSKTSLTWRHTLSWQPCGKGSPLRPTSSPILWCLSHVKIYMTLR